MATLLYIATNEVIFFFVNVFVRVVINESDSILEFILGAACLKIMHTVLILANDKYSDQRLSNLIPCTS